MHGIPYVVLYFNQIVTFNIILHDVNSLGSMRYLLGLVDRFVAFRAFVDGHWWCTCKMSGIVYGMKMFLWIRISLHDIRYVTTLDTCIFYVTMTARCIHNKYIQIIIHNTFVTHATCI